MYTKMMLIIVSFVSLETGCGKRRRIRNYEEANDCHRNKCGSLFNCACEEESWREADGQCIPPRWLCDGWKDCDNNADEIDCHCPPHEFQCGENRGGDVVHWWHQYNCIPIALVGDGSIDCYNGKDELIVNGSSWCDGLLERSPSLRCSGWIICPDAADEMGCECPPSLPNRCACNQPGDEFSCRGIGLNCYDEYRKCDGEIHCADASDEEACTCGSKQFTCQCYRDNLKTCSYRSRGCIPMSSYRDGKEDCEDGSDEREYNRRTKCGACDVTIRRFDFIEQCEVYPDCDNKTCIIVPPLQYADYTKYKETEVICMSLCATYNASQSCDVIFQCENGYLEVAQKFCDGKVDCPDGSDEIRNQPGFKCSSSFGRCVLPQRNLFDDVAQCKDAEDLCSENPCFQCLDGKLNISHTQLCDRVIDCFDLSDECLCQVNFHKPVCENMFFALNEPSELKCGKSNVQNLDIRATSIETVQRNNHSGLIRRSNLANSTTMSSNIRCENKFGEITAHMCDGRPECKNFEDECSCDDPPNFCNNNSCSSFFPLGDRYCDGINDEAWKFINDSSCLEGFDEESCPQRFACKAGNLVSIDIEQVCDGRIDCDDGSDEGSCMRDSLFSSEFEMIESVVLRCVFWVMSVLVIIGNVFVVFSTTRLLCKEKISESQKFNRILIMNLSLSDLLMGFYLLAISIKSVQYSGNYGKVDSQWRTSLECSIIGSLAVISSETSCFIMTIITAFRLYNVFNPLSARTASTLKWKLGIILAWSVSLVLALLPVFKVTSNYFVHEVWFSNKFTSSEAWKKTKVMTFVCRLASLSNQSIEANGDAWESTQLFLNQYFPEYSPKGEFGYYGETSVCMPRLYVNHGDHAWLYSLTIITFNFISFLFVAISYILLSFKMSNRPVETSRSAKQSAEMQKRIARLIATDFACWVPICIMVYMNTGGVDIPDVVYLVTAGLLLPLNSAINPLLYSPIVEKYFKRIFLQKQGHNQREIQMRVRNYFLLKNIFK